MFKPAVKIATLFYLSTLSAFAGINIDAARIWPAQDYTRLTLESKQAIRSNMFIISNPHRLVIDLEEVDANETLNNLTKLIDQDDPYIKSVRVGNYKPGTIRLVLDLKNEVKPQLFELKPVGNYGHRLVLDIYPSNPADPLLALLEPEKPSNKTPTPDKSNKPPIVTDKASNKPNVATASAVAAIPENKPPIDNKTLTDNKQAARPEHKSPAVPELRNRTVTIAIDAGHGGEDPGAHGRNGSLEKNITLTIARKVKEVIDSTPNMRAVLTRDGDYFIPLNGRVTKARKIRADLFVSIHADAFISPEARGSSVFALSEHGATSAAARWLAKKENEADLIGGVNIDVKDPYLARTLLDLSQTATNNDSLKLAKFVLKELGEINKLHRGEVEQAGFAVLKAPDIPSILVETAFISNPGEESRLNDENYQYKLALAIVNGIKRYFAQNPAFSKQKIAQSESIPQKTTQ